MVDIKLKYDHGYQTGEIPDHNFNGTIVVDNSEFLQFSYQTSEQQLVENSLDNPIDSPTLERLATGKKDIVIISSDHTRPVPSAIIMPIILRRIRSVSPDAQITILIATGTHRASTEQELIAKYGQEIFDNEKIIIHDSRDDSSLTDIGVLPSGARCVINKLAAECDLLVAEGFIEPHFFAGFSGGRKAVFPGVAGYTSVVGNHNGLFIDSLKARTGNLTGNPIHQDMVYAAKLSALQFIVNVVLDHDKRIIGCFSGDSVTAHEQGCQFVRKTMSASKLESDITITCNGGYPLDQNIYQAVKGMTAAEATTKPGGVIIMVAGARDGHGGSGFFNTFKDAKDVRDIIDEAKKTPADKTIPDQWQSQILARVMSRFHVIFVTDLISPQIILDMKLDHSPSLQEAINKAFSLQGENAKVTVIPDGVSVIIE
ncbi:lactate racemization operon protein LarA [Tatumella morbirosei]|uniref:Lactate racemization operon protein LarA n=1 Tax=Tatumella morbirosei TaxID=642227 RepID=A0A095VPZ1_9GAMM|nr:nickel-dependent lactate racemase [Tatumella morbirosei]KGD76700.1 lactate racemization operon protein LarA [Tatumella morbirosei]